jgi:hypothetical protein
MLYPYYKSDLPTAEQKSLTKYLRSRILLLVGRKIPKNKAVNKIPNNAAIQQLTTKISLSLR